MKVVFRVTEQDDFDHVKVEYTTKNQKETLAEFEEAIKKRYPNFQDYYWRRRPSREEHREFETDGTSIVFYARFSVRKDGHRHPNAVGGPDGAAQ